jgi:glutamate dehydrogenase (NAD(P)+)
VLVAASDSRGATQNPRGLDLAALVAHKHEGVAVADFPGGEPIDRDALIGVDCEIWIPAARPDAIREDNVEQLRARMVVSGANISATEGAEKRMHERGVLNVPDFIANAGGVICAAMEYQGASQTAAFEAIEDRIRRNTEQVLECARRHDVPPRRAAVDLARQRLETAMKTRRWSSF